MTFKAAVDRINTWSVTGVTTNYGIDDLPGEIPQAQLPALVLMPGEDGPGIHAFDIMSFSSKFTVVLDHYLLVSGIALKRPQDRLYDTITLVDNYITKILQDWTLNSTLLEPLEIVNAEFGLQTIGGALYYGVRFKHRWTLNL